MKVLSIAIAALSLAQQATAFSLPTKSDATGTTASRRDFFAQSTAAVVALSTLSFNPETASASVSGVAKVNAKLKGFGLPPVAPVPDGFLPVIETYGKGKNRSPLLVTFSHPLSWVVTLPSNNVNGEGGTIQAGDYGKGDTATLYVHLEPGNVGDITKQPKDVIEASIKKSISQRGDNMYQNFKLTKVVAGTGPYLEGQNYVIADFKYQLLTGAGFEVDRKGVASLTSEGAAIEVLWAASTEARYKKTETTLRNIVASFRCYSDGINFSDELLLFEDLNGVLAK